MVVQNFRKRAVIFHSATVEGSKHLKLHHSLRKYQKNKKKPEQKQVR